MSTKEKAVRDAALALYEAIIAARKAGLVVTWPGTVAGLLTIGISETGKLANEPIDLSDAERAALPRLDPSASNDPANHVLVDPAKGKSAKS